MVNKVMIGGNLGRFLLWAESCQQGGAKGMLIWSMGSCRAETILADNGGRGRRYGD
jgi:hypothetical protein